MPIDEKKILQNEQVELKEKNPDSRTENPESLRERIRAFTTRIKEAFSVFGSQRKSAEMNMESMNTAASFTPEEQAELSRIEASAQVEADRAAQSLETLELDETGSETAEIGGVASKRQIEDNGAMEKIPAQNSEVPVQENAVEAAPASAEQKGALSLDDILNKAEGQMVQEKQEVAAEQKVEQEGRAEFQKKYDEARVVFREKNAEHDKQSAILEGELLYAVEAGKNQLISQKTKALLENRRDGYAEVGKYDPDVALQTPRGKDVESWNAAQARRVDGEINDEAKFKDAVESDVFSAQRALMGEPNPSGYGGGNIERFVRNPQDLVSAMQEARQKRVQQGLEGAWWTNAAGKLEYGKSEELKKNPAEYQKVLQEIEGIDDSVYKPKELTLGVGRAALEANDFDTAIYAFSQMGLLENPQALETLNQKVQQLSESKDPKLNVLIAKLREAKASKGA